MLFRNSNRTFWLFGAVFLIYFLLLFLYFPLSGKLPGHADTLYNLAFLNDYGNRIGAFFTGDTIGRAYYPATLYQAYSELYLGEAAIYLPFKGIGLNDIWAYYFFIVVMYASNGLGVAWFLKKLQFDNKLSLIGGFAFSSSAFIFSQIELLNGIPFFFFFLLIIQVLHFTEKHNPSSLYLAACFAGIQLYFSGYILAYALFISCIILLRKEKWSLFSINTLKHLLLGGLIFILIIAPYTYLLYKFGIKQGGVNFIDFDNIHRFSISLSDVFRPLPGNLIYTDHFPVSTSNSFRVVNYGFWGFALWILSVVGLYKCRGYTWKIAILFIVTGIIFAIGPYIQIGEVRIPGPLYLFYKYFGLNNLLRIPARAYSILIFGMILLSLLLLKSKSVSKIFLLPYLFLAFFLLENVPFLMNTFENKFDIKLPVSLEVYLKDIPNESIVLMLPSSLFSNTGYQKSGMSEFSREELYTYWQSKHKKNTLNGIAAFMSNERKDVNQLIINRDWDGLTNKYQVNYIVFMDSMIIDHKESSILMDLIHSKNLVLQERDSSMSIFKVQIDKF